MATNLQNLRTSDIIVNPDGTPTLLLMRLLQDRGTLQGSVEQQVLDLQNDKADKVRQIIAGLGLTGGGDLSADRTIDVGTASSGRIVVNANNIDLATTAVSAGSYTNANITVDAYGRITAASNGSSGGSGASVASIIIKATPAVSSSAFATKGQIFRPLKDYTSLGVYASFDTVASASYKATIFTISGGNVGTIIATSSTLTPGAGTRVFLYFPFASSVTLSTGTSYAVVITRTDSTTTYALPLITGVGTFSALLYNVTGGAFALESGARMTSTSPTVGQAVDTSTPITTTYPFEVGMVGNH